MKNIRNIAVASLLLLSVSFAMAQNQWTAGGTSQNWSDGANWSGGAPGGSDILYFQDLNAPGGYTNMAKAVNNVVDANTSVGAINYTAMSYSTTNHFHTTLIPGGVTLTLGGLGTTPPAALAVGDVPGSLGWLNASSWTNYSAITGAGSLVVNDPASLISVGMRNRATLDLAGLNTFSANVKQIWVGVSDDNPNTSGPTGWLLLAKTNTITTTANLTAPGILMGYATNSSPSSPTLLLGAVNVFNTDGLTVGGRRSSSTKLAFASTGNFTLRGSAGGSTPTPVFSVGDLQGNWNGYSATYPGTSSSASSALADFSGGTVDILADSIFLGRSANTAVATQSGTGTGTLIVNQGNVTTTNLYISLKEGLNTSVGRGTLYLGGSATMNVVSNVSLVFRTNGTGFIDESIVGVSNSATLNIGGNLTSTMTVGSWTPPVIRLGGGTINMTGNGLVSVPRINGAGYLTNASSITVTNELVVGTDITAETLTVGNNLTLGSAVKPIFNLGVNTTVGGGVNDYLNVANNVIFNNNPITLSLSAPLVVGTYKLIGYGGTQSGSVTWVNSSRYPIGLVQGSGQVAIVVTNVTPANLVWQATGTSAAWDKTSSSWNGNTDKFYDWDNVRFDDTGVATNITLAITNYPNSVTVSNNTKGYLFTLSTGRIGGHTGLTKDGTGSLYMSGTHDFTGPVNINAGTIQAAGTATSVFGGANATTPISIAAGGMLDLYGNSVGSSSGGGRPLNIAGTGVGAQGAIAHTRDASSPSIYNSGITLAANASVGATYATRAITLSGNTTPYAAQLDLAGNTLTTTGAGEVRIYQMTATNSGNIYVGGPSLGIRNSIIDGPGAIDLGNSTLNLYSGYTTGYVAKTITATNGVIMVSSQNAATIPLMSPINLAAGGSLTVSNLQTVDASGIISGNASLTKIGVSNLVLSAANTYSGPTVVSQGRLSLGILGSLASPSITVDGGAVLDVTAKVGGYTLPTGQSVSVSGVANGDFTTGSGSALRGSGTVAGLVTVASGGSLACGTPVAPGTLTVTNLSFTGGTATFKLGATTPPGGGVNDLVVVNGNLNFTNSMTIKIEPAATLSGTYTLFQYSGSLLGSTNNIAITSEARYAYTLDTSVSGEIRVTISGGAGNLTWKGGVAGSPTAWDIVTTTNWMNGSTNDYFYQGDSVTFDDSGNTNVVTLAATVKPAVITMNNASTAYILKGSGGLFAGSLTMGGGGNVSIENNVDNTFTGAGLVLNAGPLTFNQATNATLASKLSGYSGLAKSGSSTLTVVSADSTNFNGTVAVNGGTLRSGSGNALGSSSVTVNNGATLDVNGQVGNLLTSISAGGAGVGGSGAINNTGAQQTNAVNNLWLNGDTTLSAASNRWDVAGTLSGNAYKLTKSGNSDIWIKSGSDTGLGDIDVAGGRLVFANAGTLLGSTSSNIVVRTNAVLGFANGAQDPGKNTRIEAGGSLYSTGSTNVYGGSIVLSNGLVKLESNTRLELSGNLSGPAGLLVQGVNAGNYGTLTLSGSNSYTGGTLVNDGALVIASSNAIPANTNVILSSRVAYNQSGHPQVTIVSNVVTPAGVTLEMQTVGSAGAAQATLSGDGATWAGPILITGNNNNCVANFNSGQGGLTVNGAINASGFVVGTSANGGFKVNGQMANVTTLQGGAITLNSQLIMNAPMSMPEWQNIDGTMTKLVLNASSNYWVSANINSGMIQIGANNAIPSLSPILVRNLFIGADHRFVTDLNGYNQSLGAFDHGAGGPGEQPVWFGNSSTNADSVLSHIGSITNTWSAFIVDAFDTNAPVQRKLGLTVSSGYLRLMSSQFTNASDFNVFSAGPAPGPMTNTYSGPTLVSGGILRVDTGIPNSAVTVTGTGTLMGTGTLGGSLVVNPGGTLAPGASIGTLTVSNNVTLAGKCLMEVNLTAGTYDKIVGISNLTYGGTIVVTNVGAQAFTNGTILPLFSAASYTPGSVVVQPSPGFGLRWDTSYLAVDGTLRVTTVSTTPVPIGSSVSGGGTTLDLSWPTDHIGWRLQTQTNNLSVGLAPAWFDVAGSTITNQMTLPIVPGNPSVFFRLVHP